MNGPVAAMLQAARRALQDAVLPELRDGHARSQLAGVLDILGKLERMTEWSTAMVREEAEALRKGIAAFEARAAAAGLQPPAAGAPTGNELADAHARLRDLSDFLFERVPPGSVLDDLDAVLRAALRDAVATERRHVPRSDFSAMTDSKD